MSRIDQALQIRPDRLRDLLSDLVDIYSPSGKEEEILGFVERHLQSHGLAPVRQEIDESRYNLVVFPPQKDEVDLCFVGHLDTVAAYDLEEYGFEQEDDTAYGLGTADMKGGCAAMIEAFTVLAERGQFPPVGLALVVDEEEDNKGAEVLVNEYAFPWAVIGEPTDLVPCLGHYGYLEVGLRTGGKRAHSAMPELGRNAIEDMLKLLLSVTENIISSPYGVVYNIRELSSFPGGFIVPDVCEAWLDLHLPPNSRIDALKTGLEQLVTGVILSGSEAHLWFGETHSGYLISQERPLVKTLQQCYERLSLTWKPQDFRSHSDGNTLWAAGVDPIIIGPGRLEEAHTPEESTSLSQVALAAQLYLDFALSLQGGLSGHS